MEISSANVALYQNVLSRLNYRLPSPRCTEELFRVKPNVSTEESVGGEKKIEVNVSLRW